MPLLDSIYEFVDECIKSFLNKFVNEGFNGRVA